MAGVKRVDLEIDYHGYTVREMLADLEAQCTRTQWSSARRVRLIHGTGEALWHELRSWCTRRRLAWAPEPHNTGCTLVYPASRSEPHAAAPRPRRCPARRTAAAPLPEAPAPAPSPANAELMEMEMAKLGGLDHGQVRRLKGAD
ncbi:MAG: hypothetical protein NT029_21725 [Armatimonadetes bacterium]|nr:hypothetical protein [Armatimonadota bacterium]